jgi:uncharacterized protein (UPF0218 family)
MPYAFDEELKSRLRIPMGPVYASMPDFIPKSRIIAVGDMVVLGLLKKGITPFVAVFDLKTRRAPITKEEKGLILSRFPNPIKASNPAGYLTEEAIDAAEKAMSKGGAVLIDGEEDLTLLAFLAFAKSGDVFIYGIMGSGVCVINGQNAKNSAVLFLKNAKRSPPA